MEVHKRVELYLDRGYGGDKMHTGNFKKLKEVYR